MFHMLSPAILTFLGSACAVGLALGTSLTAKRSLPRWSFALGMAMLAMEAFFAGWSLQENSPAQVEQWQVRRLVAQSVALLAWTLFGLTYARGSNRQILASDVVKLFGVAALPALGLFFFRDGLARLNADGGFNQGSPHSFRLFWGGIAFHSLFLLGLIGVLMELERTFRASVGTIRWRIKFMLLGLGVIFVTRVYTCSQILVFRDIDTAFDSINAGALVVATPLILLSLLRTRHFDFDVYPSRAAIQGSLTLLLAGIYLLSVGALAKAVTYFGGESAFALKALVILVAVVALALVLQSDRAKQRLREFVSHHFHRPVHDYRLVWKKFTEATASRVNQLDLLRATATLTADTFQALSVSVWVTNEKRDALTLVSSTSARGSESTNSNSETIAASEVIGFLQSQTEPVDIETEAAPWAGILRGMHPVQFPNGGHRCCVPLVSCGEVLGVIIIGDRVGGRPMSLQDFEMLKCVSDHAAANLMNVWLSKKLVQAKELEAFQSMAAFFIHDLKNAAATLGLMLENLPVHFDNPEFRADALRGISKSVTHINRLISRLSQLRRELTIEPVDTDLNEIVAQALAGLEHPSSATLIKDIKPLPLIRLDGDQLNKVVTNLVLNATEAVSTGGRVRVATSQQNGWVVLTVDDNGCGMTNEFMAHSLFRPFQTTKANGLGIGMFQSKMIVEAHGGRIAVESEPGEGTTFQVFLRAPTTAN